MPHIDRHPSRLARTQLIGIDPIVSPADLPPLQGRVDGAHQVANRLHDELPADPPLDRFYNRLLHPAAREFEQIERRGVAIDVDKYHQLNDAPCAEIMKLEKQALDLLPCRLRAKHRDKIAAQVAAL